MVTTLCPAGVPWVPRAAWRGSARRCRLCSALGPAPAAPSPLPLPSSGSHPTRQPRAACSWLLLSLAEPPLQAHGAPSSAPFRSLTAAMAEGERALCRSDQGTLMPEPHPPDSCPGKRILLLNSLLGVFVSTPPSSPSSLRVLARPSGCAGAGGEERGSAWVLGQDVCGAGWLLGSCHKVSGPLWGRSPALDSKHIGGSEGEEGFGSSSIPAPENPPAASPAPARPPRRTARLLLLCFCPHFSAKLRHSQERQSPSPKFAVWRCWVTRLWVEVLGQGCGRQPGLGSAPRSPSRHQTR